MNRKIKKDYELPSLFIEGYLHDRITKSDYPKYKLPISGLPITSGRTINICSIFDLIMGE